MMHTCSFGLRLGKIDCAHYHNEKIDLAGWKRKKNELPFSLQPYNPKTNSRLNVKKTKNKFPSHCKKNNFLNWMEPLQLLLLQRHPKFLHLSFLANAIGNNTFLQNGSLQYIRVRLPLACLFVFFLLFSLSPPPLML